MVKMSKRKGVLERGGEDDEKKEDIQENSMMDYHY